MSVLAKRYARALFQAASEKDAVDPVAADLARVGEAMRDARVRALVLDPRTQRSKRRAVLDKLVGGGHELSRNLMTVLLERRRESLLPELHEAYVEMVRDAHGEVEGVLESARPMRGDEVEALARKASATFGKKVSLRLVHRPELIGGIRVRVGTTLYDASVATALEDLERRLMEVPV